MITRLVTILIVACFVSCTKTEIAENADIESSNTIIDVRSAEEFNAGHIEKAINIPHTEISEKISQHEKNKDAQIIVYCRSGRRSGIAKSKLEAMGYTNVTNAGGYEDLKAKKTE